MEWRFTVAALILSLGAVTAASQPASPTLTLRLGHSRRLRCLVFNPSGERLLTASEDWTWKLWDCRSGELLRSLQLSGSWAPAACYTPDGRTLAILAGGGIQLRSVESLQLQRTLPSPEQLSCLAFSGNGKVLAVGRPGETVTLWSMPAGKQTRTLRTHVGWLGNLALSADGALLACDAGHTGIPGSNVELWDTRTGTLLRSIKSNGEKHGLAFSPDGKLLAVGAGSWLERETRVELWEVSTGRIRRRLEGHTADIISLAFSRDGRQLGSADTAGTVKLWALDTGAELRSFTGSGLWTEAVVAAGAPSGSRSGFLAASVDPQRRIQLYDLSGGKPIARLPGLPFAATTAALGSDGYTLAVGGELDSGNGHQGAVQFWDLRTGNWKGTLQLEKVRPSVIALSSDGKRLAAGTWGGVEVWDLEHRKQLGVREEQKLWVHALAFLPDGTLAVGGDREKSAGGAAGGYVPGDPFLERWDLPSLELRQALHPGSTPEQLLVDPAGKTLLGTGLDGQIRAWSLAAPLAAPRRLLPDKVRLDNSTLTRDGRLAVGTTPDGQLMVWSLQPPKLLSKLPLNKDFANRALLSKVGSYAAVGPHGGALDVRDMSTGQRLRMTPPGGSQAPVWAAFPEAGSRFVTVESSGAIRWWDLGERRLLATIQPLGPEGTGEEWVAHTSDGYYAASPDASGAIRWRTPEGLQPSSRFAAERNRPDRVQIALTGAPQPELFALLTQREQDLRRTPGIGKVVQTQPPPPQPPDTPTARLRAALTTQGMLGDAKLQKQVSNQIRRELAAGADPNTSGGWGTTPLLFFAATGDLQGLRDLIGKKVDLNHEDVYRSTALLDAVSGEHWEAVDLLLAAGADLKDTAGHSLLQLRGAALSAKLLEVLVQERERQERNEGGTTDQSPEPIAMLLLRRGADPNVRHPKWGTPLLMADTPQLMKALLERGANPEVRDASGNTPLIGAALHGQTELAKVLLTHRARADNPVPDSGYTALLYAAQNGREDMVRMLLEHGADPNRRSQELWTPLNLAISGGHLEIVRLLLARGAKPELRGYEGWTPLCYAVNGGDITVVRLLLARKANVRVRTSKGETLLQLVRKQDPKGQTGIAALLVKAGAR